jgi:hypothetical protein
MCFEADPTMKSVRMLAALFLGTTAVAAFAQSSQDQKPHYTAPYNVVWTSPSHYAAGSMPLGNGQVGINLWVEEDGDLRFYISRNDSFTEVSQLVKVGGVRISLDPNPFKKGMPFRQELRLHEGLCEITAGEEHRQVALKVFVDSQAPVVHVVLATSDAPVKIRVAAEVWRTKPHSLDGEELKSSWTLHSSPVAVIESADVFARTRPGAIAWYHRNETSPAFSATMKLQSLGPVADTVRDPLLRRTFGAYITGEGFKSAGDQAIESGGGVHWFSLKVSAPCVQSASAQGWLDDARHVAAASSADAQPTMDWWSAYWARSHVIVNGDQGQAITRAYTLQRYMQAIGGRGPFPIKFNGGQFTVEPKAMGKPYDADWRAWGDCHWWQNVRHMYHPMLAEGDFEMMDPLFDMYEAARPLCEARARLYHGAEGCYFPETMTVWGTYSNGDYGWDRAGHQPKDVLSPWWRYAWNQGPELVALMLDRWDYTGDKQFLTGRVLPMAESVLKYFDTRFKKDATGHILLDPTQAIETYWHGVVNDMPTTAGLNDISARLCALPESLTTPSQREFFGRMRAACPAVPVEGTKVGGRAVRRLAPAQKYDPARTNCENPELYAIWPFRLYGLGRLGLEDARAAYAARRNHLDVGWGYDGNCAALLGLTDEAARILKIKCANSHPAYRWPATWGPNFDWLPDQNHGGNLLETAQLMLLQPVGEKLLLLPAWPKTWDVDFKLHAPRQTIVECAYRHGRIERLAVTPESRRADIVLPAIAAVKP